jgi:pimeloyl-ACP methyl ester carboxylesterase
MSPAGQADLYAAFLDALGVKEAIVMGISAGGPSAVTFAARYPERCKALIMLCAVSKAMEIKEEELSASNQMLAAARDSDFLMWLAIHLTIRTLPLVALRQPELRSRLISNPARMRMYSRVMWGLFPATLRRTGTIYDEEIIKVLPPLPFKKVTAPTLVLHGTADTLVPPDNARNTASKIPGADLILVRGGEHAFFVPYYDEVWPEVRQFLAQSIKPPKAAAAKPSSDSKPKAAAKPAPKRPTTTKRTTARATPATKAPPRPRPARRTPSGQ